MPKVTTQEWEFDTDNIAAIQKTPTTVNIDEIESIIISVTGMQQEMEFEGEEARKIVTAYRGSASDKIGDGTIS